MSFFASRSNGAPIVIKAFGAQSWVTSTEGLRQLQDEGRLFAAPGGLDDQVGHAQLLLVACGGERLLDRVDTTDDSPPGLASSFQASPPAHLHATHRSNPTTYAASLCLRMPMRRARSS